MSYDVVVVGAGPAGATAARFLAEKEANVLLVDKHTFPRDKPCGGMIQIRTLARFPYIPKELISSVSSGGSIWSSSLKKQLPVKKEAPIAAFVVRKDFDYGLVRLAQNSGVTLNDGVGATSLLRTRDKVVVGFENGEVVESKLVIGADGVWSMVAKQSGLGQHYPHIGRCLFQELPVSRTDQDEFFSERKFHLFLKFMGIPGFGWVAPKNGLVNIGVGEVQPLGPQQHKKPPLKQVFREFLRVLVGHNIIPPAITPGTLQGGALPLRPLERTYAGRVVLCGDAAGQMNPLTGDGIHYAMSAGMFAADVCARALQTGNTNESFLSQYQTLWKNDFGEEMRLCRSVFKRLVKTNNDERYIRLLSKDPQIIDTLLTIASTQGRIQDHKWSIVRRFASLYVRDLFGL